MKKSSLCGLLAAALAAVAYAAMCWREGSQVNSGYAQFAACPSPETALSIAQRKEMIEIQREKHLSSEIKVHPPEGPNEPILGSNCYVGSKSNSFHEQNQLKELVVQAIRR
jgi:hypothetical protein